MSNKMVNNDIIYRISKLECEKKSLISEEIALVEKILEIKFPPDFIQLNSNCSYEYICFCSTFNFGMSSEYSVIGKTLAWRESENFPKNCVALAEDAESAIIMRITGDNAEVIWCDISDLYNLCEGKPFEYNPTIFPSFTDFYSFLLDEEEKIRSEAE